MRNCAEILPVALHLDLSNAGWDGQLNPYPGISQRQYMFQSLARSLMKKFEDKPLPEANSRALDLFVKMNDHCAKFVNPEPFCTEAEWQCFGEMRLFLARFFTPAAMDWENRDISDTLNSSDIGQALNTGNGSNIGSPGVDFLSKVSLSSMATSSVDLYKYFVQSISNHRVWSNVESIRLVNRGVEVVAGSRLSFVPKNTEISRTICTEPVLNMFFQKGIQHCIEKRLIEVCGIDLTVQQDYNRVLCRIGSEHGRYGTIDLSSASDTISRGLISWLLPRQAVSWLDLTRTSIAVLPNGDHCELHMVSSMGNAFTFPLQTTIFTSLVYAAYKILDIPIKFNTRRSIGNFAVNGDDIIVVTKAYGLVTRLLSLCGFIVNVHKSFNEGPFRESCGCDYFDGHDVRGVYIKSLKSSSDRYSAINRLNVWSAKHRVLLPHTIAVLLKGLRFLPIPPYESDDSGVKVPRSMLKRLKLGKGKHAQYGILYKMLVPRPRQVDVTDIASQPPKLRGWFENPDAVLLAALASTLKDGKVTPRSSQLPSVVKVGYSSGWDYFLPDRHVNADFVGSWKTFSEANLSFFQD